MQTKSIVALLFVFLSANFTLAQSFSCTPENVIFASNGGTINTVEETKVNWKRIDYHISGKTAVTITYKEKDNLSTDINPTQKDEMRVLHQSPEKIVLIGSKFGNPMELTVDVLFPKDGNGYSFYVSDYPKTLSASKSDLVNLSKLYMLKCKEISTPNK